MSCTLSASTHLTLLYRLLSPCCCLAQSAQLIDLNLRALPAGAAGPGEQQLLLDDLAGDAPAVAVSG